MTDKIQRALDRLSRTTAIFWPLNPERDSIGTITKPLAALIEAAAYLINGTIDNTQDNEALAAAKKADCALMRLVDAVNGEAA